MSNSKDYRIRLSLQNSEEVVRLLRQTGTEGEAMARKLERAARGAGPGLKALDASANEVSGALTGLSGQAGGVGRVLSTLGPAGRVAAVGIGAVVGVLAAGLHEFGKAEQSGVRLEAVLRAAGDQAMVTADQIKELADDLEQRTLFSAEQVQDAAVKLVTFRSVSEENFGRVIELSTDLAATFNMDLTGAMSTVAKAMGEPERASKLLRSAGVNLDQQQKDMIKSFMDAGDAAAAQEVILAALEARVGGVAEQMGNTSAGAANNLKDAFDNLTEESGRFATELIGLPEKIMNVANALRSVTDYFKEDTPEEKILEKQRELIDERMNMEKVLKEAREEGDEASARSAQAYIDRLVKQTQEAGEALAALKKTNAETKTTANPNFKPVINRPKSAETKKDTEAVREYIESLEDEYRIVQLNNRERAVAEAMLKAETAARREGRSLRADEIEQIKELSAAQFDYEDALKKTEEQAKELQKQQEEWARDMYRPFDTAAENVQTAFADMFYEGKLSFESLGDIAKRTAAEVAAAWVIKPVITGAMSMIGLGVSSGGNIITGGGSSGGAAGGVGGIGDLSSIGSFLANGSLYSSTLGGWGYSLGSMLDPAGLIGPSMYGNIGAGALGNMGYGALGGLAASLLGLGGGVGGMVGGTLGSLAGGAIGTSMGSILGMAGGPLGSILGGFAGTALGGLFGGGSVPSRYVGGFVDYSGGKFTPGYFGSDEATKDQIDAYKQLQQTTAEGLNSLSAVLGVTIKSAPRLMYSSSGKRDGGVIRVGVQGYGNDVLGSGINDMRTHEAFTDPEKAVAYALRMVMANADFEGVSQSMEVYFKKAFTRNGSMEDALKDIENVKAIFAEVEEPLTAAEQAIKSLNETFDGFKETAVRLGFTVADLNKVEADRQKKLEEVRKGYNDTLDDAILGIVDPVALAVEQEMKRYQAQLKEAQAIGADTQRVEVLHQLYLQQIYGNQAQEIEQIASQFAQLGSQLQATKTRLLTSELSTLSPQQQYNLIRSQFEDTGARARLGDIDALQQLSGVTEDFLKASRAMYGSGSTYANDFSRAMDTLTLAKDTTDRQTQIQQDLLDQQKEAVNLIRLLTTVVAAGGNAQAGQLAEIADKLAELNDRYRNTQAA